MASDSELIKSKIDIVDLISSRIDLKKAGKHYKSACPFHADNDPSFVVSPELQIYKCFGCGKSGDIFTFLEEYEGMDFVEALEYLAEKANVTLTRRIDSGDQKRKLIDIHLSVNNFYKYILSSHSLGRSARKYLSNRGITQEIINKFEIGYSPMPPEPYQRYAIDKKKFSPKDLEIGGLAYTYYGKPKDRFAGRITFPLSDHRGVILGFAGRILPENDNGKVGKYINSPETDIYHKSKMLYGLNLAKDDIRKTNTCLLVEGELDMISSYQAGIRNTVAIKGSALTADQALLIKRFADKIIFALDADFAGNAAARRGIEIAEEARLEVNVAVLGKFKDPDEAIRKDLSKYKEILKNSKSAWDYLVDGVFERHDATTGAGKQKISREVVPLLVSMKDSIVRSHYVMLISRRLSIDQEAVLEQLSKSGVSEDKSKQKEAPPEKRLTRRELLEERFLSLSLQFNPSLIDRKLSRLIKTRKFSLIVEEFLRYKKNKATIDLQDFSAKLPVHLVDSFQTLVLKSDDRGVDPQKELELTQKELRIIGVKEEMKELSKTISSQEKSKEKSKLSESQERLTVLTQKLAKLSD